MRLIARPYPVQEEIAAGLERNEVRSEADPAGELDPLT